MSRLDAFIHRVLAQRACIDAVAAKTSALSGPVLELGLGNGRTYDHLRFRFPQRDIFVFDREVAAQPDSIPPEHLLRLGDFRATVPAYLAEDWESAVFIHADIGSFSNEKSVRLAADLAPTLLRILAPGAYLACDQHIVLDGLERLALPDGLEGGYYHFYRRQD